MHFLDPVKKSMQPFSVHDVSEESTVLPIIRDPLVL